MGDEGQVISLRKAGGICLSDGAGLLVGLGLLLLADAEPLLRLDQIEKSRATVEVLGRLQVRPEGLILLLVVF